MTREILLTIAKPILFNTEMVKAILEGRKTVTRRVVRTPKNIELQDNGLYTLFAEETYYKNQKMEEIIDYIKKPYQPGDILYVRETWQHLFELDGNEQIIEGTGKYYYAATDKIPFDTYVDSMGVTHGRVPWKPSIHMLKEAARIFLKVTDVRVERLQDMQSVDAFKEGVRKSDGLYGDMMEFYKLWNSTIKKADLDKYGWEASPWVWVIEFERVEVE